MSSSSGFCIMLHIKGDKLCVCYGVSNFYAHENKTNINGCLHCCYQNSPYQLCPRILVFMITSHTHTICICDCIWENQLVSEKNKVLFYCFFYLSRRAKMPLSKLEANPTLRLRVRHASFSSSISVFWLERLFPRVHGI